MKRTLHHRRSPIVRLLSPLRDFLATEASGAILIAVAAIAALVWANSPWRDSYAALWSNQLSISVGRHAISLDLRHWINDGLMTVFFFVVGLEIKRETTDGHLASRRAVVLPVAAAIGGMAVPALIYLGIAGRTAAHGWAVPMATDIALAVGILAIAGDRVASSLRAFLLGLAIVDDIGAIVIIAAVYSTGTHWSWLGSAAAALVVAYAARRFGVQAAGVYIAIGVVAWYGLFRAGIHPTLAGVALGLMAPATPRIRPELIDVETLADLSDVESARETSALAKDSVSVVEWLQHALHPWTSYLIVPLFALANTGIEVSADGMSQALRSPITWGVICGLVVGKPLGIIMVTRVAVMLGAADRPAGSTPRQMMGIGTAAGIGFTVALFIADLAFTNQVERNDAKLAILTASIIAAAVSTLTLTVRGRTTAVVATTSS